MTRPNIISTLSLPRAVLGCACTGYGLVLLLELPTSELAGTSGYWLLWSAAVAQLDGGLLLAAGLWARGAAPVCAGGLGVTAVRLGGAPEGVDGVSVPAWLATATAVALVVLTAARSRRSRRLRHRPRVLPRAGVAGVAAFLLVASIALTGPAGPRPARVAPAALAQPAGLWTQRPQLRLAYLIDPSLKSVTGRETGTFIPDLATCELVVRAWPNNPTISATGGALRITGATIDGQQVRARLLAADAPPSAPPTLVRMGLPRCVQAGQPVAFDLEFGVTLGADADERLGYSPKTRTAWFGSAFPMLSWVRGQGWTSDPAVSMNGESAVSEDFALHLSVTAPTDLAVQGVGAPTGTTPGPAGMTTHQFSAPAVRDVTVGLGRYRVLNQQVGGVRLHLATPTSGSKADPGQWAAQLSHSMTGLAELFGAFPYADFWVTLTPGQSDGTEFPEALQFSDTTPGELPALVTHEVSHQRFYGLVGNNQARDPWLDEALATYGVALLGGDAEDFTPSKIPHGVVGLMGQPMSYWPRHGGFDRYTDAVYNQGAAALLQARAQVGAQAFDQALRGYLTINAHRVATPADFAAAFHELPPVITLLRQAGALSAPD